MIVVLNHTPHGILFCGVFVDSFCILRKVLLRKRSVFWSCPALMHTTLDNFLPPASLLSRLAGPCRYEEGATRKRWKMKAVHDDFDSSQRCNWRERSVAVIVEKTISAVW